jgi:hypothetical protein
MKIKNSVKNVAQNYDRLKNQPKRVKRLAKPLRQAKLLWKIVIFLI